MNCPCDIFEFPPRLYIPAGLSRLPRQIGTFTEFRRALLHYLGVSPGLKDWRGRQPDDFGVMLLEMWAYVCDSIAFYDEVQADEDYLGTAVRPESLRRLTALLGYRPRPAVGAAVELAAFAEGRRVVTLPAGTAFRSGGFDGNPPQTFELQGETAIHPFSNQWTLQPVRPATFGPSALNQNFLLCVSGSASVKKEDVVLVRVATAVHPRIVAGLLNHKGADGATYTKVEFDSAVPIPANTAVSAVSITKPTLSAGLWPRSHDGASFSTGALIFSGFGSPSAPPAPFAYLDAVYRTVRAGQDILFQSGTTLAARRVTATSLQLRTVAPASTTIIKDASNNDVKVPVPPTTSAVSKLNLDRDLEGPIVIFIPGGVGGPFTSVGLTDIAVHLGFVAAATVTVEASTTLSPGNPLQIPLPIERPSDADPPGRFQLEDKNNFGVAVNASLDYDHGSVQLGQDAVWGPPLSVPVRLFGNIITATRGESVRDELLGIGDGTQSNQSFSLKKSPLTYFPAPVQGNDLGVANTLVVRVDNVQWTEVPSFYGVAAQAAIYIVRENNAGESRVIFGDGIRGSRLASGARVTASYRFGAGAASPPAGGIHQIARPVKGLRSLRNPVAAAGGADQESSDNLRTYAPRSALLLGRAVSLADLEAATSGTGGVRAVRAEWRWNVLRQRPVAQIYYIGDPALDALITQTLRQLSEPDTPIDVTRANPLSSTLALQVTIDSAYLEDVVLDQLRADLMDPLAGLLAPERVGIGSALFRSRVFQYVTRVPGASAVTDLQLNGVSFSAWGVAPGAGNYFDFEDGSLILNGKASSN